VAIAAAFGLVVFSDDASAMSYDLSGADFAEVDTSVNYTLDYKGVPDSTKYSAKLVDGKLLTNGGRVLGVIAVAKDLKKAITKAYKKVSKIHFRNAYCRSDIGKRALKAYGEK